MPESSRALQSQSIDRVATGLAASLPVLNRCVERRIGGQLPYPKLPEAQLALLQYVAEHDGVSVRQVADALLMKPNNVSALVTHLTEAGLVERHQDHVDKRVVHLRATALAHQRIGQARGVAAQQIASALCTLTEGDLAALGSALHALEALTRQLRNNAA
ncbi:MULTISPECIES: MarR family winged helix-turn-helix transcriptional regulator [unclassified Streptomyces]|uniref:MarR family winged helix-turn-helix transcriptional regulator n=1 Tax=unclassified Streptomyces TaxID=2593676 RepID=UPI002259E876|nr:MULTISPECIES: MarR family transcriptional regulator [unclassified Streptomyces]MCX4641998.1 MarR family transcriptional regulator [Streptomyces sp. NBC_01446]MCX5085730.1 MarR family transcriptional regulator [Streptomyces sp. NBC_00401]MCX5326871.1 MarR family transcriptional regulator [Streptomyces sp. NBC_00120]